MDVMLIYRDHIVWCEVRKRQKMKTLRYRKRAHRVTVRRNKDKAKAVLNCHPAARPLHADTCQTPESLLLMKRAYTKRTGRSLRASRPADIYQELKETLAPVCGNKREDCWLEQVDPGDKRQIQSTILSPYQPAEWRKNPDEWLSNYDIANVLRQYEEAYPTFCLLGPAPIDFDKRVSNNRCVETSLCQLDVTKLWARGKRQIGIVFNLSEHDEEGSHWVSLFIDLKQRFVFYFDSAVTYGETCPPEIMALVGRLQAQASTIGMKLTFHENRLQHQHGNNECGMYSLFFLITLLTERCVLVNHGRKMSLKDKLRLFKRRTIPDAFVHRFRAKYFNVRIH